MDSVSCQTQTQAQNVNSIGRMAKRATRHTSTQAEHQVSNLKNFHNDKFIPNKILPGGCVMFPDDLKNMFKDQGVELVNSTLKEIKNGNKYEAITAMRNFQNGLNGLDKGELQDARKHIVELLSKSHNSQDGKILKAMFYMVEKEIDSRPDFNFPGQQEPRFPMPKFPGHPREPKFPLDIPINECPADKDAINYLYENIIAKN